MFRKLLVTFIVLTVACFVTSAPVYEVPPEHAVKTSHITKEDVHLLQEKLEALEADLERLEPEVPTDDDEDEEDVEPIDDDGDEAGDEFPAEEENPLKVEVPHEEDVPADEHDEHVPDVVDSVEAETSPEEIATDHQKDKEEVDQEQKQQAEDEEEEEDGEGEGGEFVPYRTPAEDDMYLEKLIVQALTILYRKDANRLENLLQEQYNRLAEETQDFPQNFAPAPQDLNEAFPDLGETKLEAGTFVDRPFSDEELQRENVIEVLEAKKKEALENAEMKLISDMEMFEDEGLTLEEIVDDLSDKQRSGDHEQRRTSMEDRTENEEEAEDAFFGNFKEDVDDEVDNDSDDEKPAPNTNLPGELQDEDSDDAEELLKELMANLNTSLMNLQGNKAPSRDM